MALNEITKGMSNAAEMINQNFKEIEPGIKDSGWLPLPLSEKFEAYSSERIPQYRRIGDIVMIRGSVRNKQLLPKDNAYSEDGNYEIGTLPTLIKPGADYVFRQQGSGMKTFLLTISSENSKITLSRYGITDRIDVEIGSWLNIASSYMI